LTLLFGACHEPGYVKQVEATAIFDTSALDFGEVPVGEWREREVTVQNAGYVPFTASEAFKLKDNPSFVVELEGEGKVNAGETRTVRVKFHPLREGALEEQVRVVTDAEHKPSEPLLLRGIGTPAPVKVFPPRLDYQTLEVESDRVLTVTVENPVDLPLSLEVAGATSDQFTSDAITLPPHSRTQVATRYLPRAPGDSEAQVRIRACPDCTPATVDLSGKAVKSAFVFDPEPVPFDDIPVHERTRSKVKATNITWRPVKVAQLRTSDRSFAPVNNLQGQELGPGNSVEVEMEFAARSAGPAVGTLAVDYSSDKPRTSEVMLDARGGRPTLALAPVTLDFGEIPVGSKAERTVRLSNAGTTGTLHFQGVKGTEGADQFNVSVPFRGKKTYPYSAGTWPELTAPNLDIAPGADWLDVQVYFEPTGPGEFRGTITFVSDDLFNPERSITVTGRARTSGPCTFRMLPEKMLDFGNVQVGSGAVLGFRFENTGRAECAVKNIRVSNDAKGVFFMPGGTIAGGPVPWDSAFSWQVAFRAQAEGSYHGEVTLEVNDPARPVVKLPLQAVALKTCLTAAPGFVDWGGIRYDCSTQTRRTYVANQCRVPVEVSAYWIGQGTAREFQVVNGPQLPRVLQPAEGFEVELSFSRASLGQHFTPMFFQATGEMEPLLVPLLGETNHEGIQVERFIQGTDSQLDVLFVVSNTTTMGPYQDRLKAAIPTWLNNARNAGVDVRMGVTSTGLVQRGTQCGGGARGGEMGRLYPVDGSSPRIISSQNANAPTQLQANLGVGMCHNLVQGLEAMRQAVTSPLVDHADDPRTAEPNDGNLGFLRSAARLAVVFVADEDDHSGFDPVSYIQLMQTLKGPGSSHRTSAYALVPTDASCRTAGPPGPRFAQVAQATGGEVRSVCGDDYVSFLDKVSRRASGAQADFRLTQQASDAGEITVKVDGRRLEAGTVWTYDAGTNSVVFAPGSVPRSGQTVEVRYRSVCGPRP
jgi:hypothetical protein